MPSTEQIILTTLSWAGISTLAASAIMFAAKTWIGERIKQSIQHEYDVKLSSLKHELQAAHDVALEKFKREAERDQTTRTISSNAFSSVHLATHERRIIAIERLWKLLLRVREVSPTFLTLIDLSTAEEEKRLLTKKTDYLELINEFDPSAEVGKLRELSFDAEIERIFVDQQLWALFFAYRALLFRIPIALTKSIQKGEEIRPCREDKGVGQMLAAALTPNERAQ